MIIRTTLNIGEHFYSVYEFPNFLLFTSSKFQCLPATTFLYAFEFFFIFQYAIDAYEMVALEDDPVGHKGTLHSKTHYTNCKKLKQNKDIFTKSFQ